MILDTSALAAVFFGEPEQDRFVRLILENRCGISAANFVELAIVLKKLGGPEVGRQSDLSFLRAEIAIEPVTVEQAHIARQAFLDFGKGRHQAGLSFGDCFSYALSKTTGRPLLFKGEDFARTDVRAAI